MSRILLQVKYVMGKIHENQTDPSRFTRILNKTLASGLQEYYNLGNNGRLGFST